MNRISPRIPTNPQKVHNIFLNAIVYLSLGLVFVYDKQILMEIDEILHTVVVNPKSILPLIWAWKKAMKKIMPFDNSFVIFSNFERKIVFKFDDESPKLLGWKKSIEKTHDSWINSYFSACERSILMWFSTICLSTFFHLQTQMKFAISTIRINTFEFEKITLFTMANSPVRSDRVEERGAENWSNRRWFSFQEINLLFDHWNPDPNRLFKMANSPVRSVRVEKRATENWLKMRWFSYQEINLLFDHWNPDPNRGRNILPVINAIKRGSISNNRNYENDSTIEVFLNFLVQA